MTDYIVFNYTDTEWTPNAGTYLIPVSVIKDIESLNGIEEFKSIHGKMINDATTTDAETAIILKIDQLIRYYDDDYLEGYEPNELVKRSERGKLACYKMTENTSLTNINIVGMVSTGFIF